MRPRAVSLTAILLVACLDSVLEAPYVLTTGLGEARSISPTARSTMLVATAEGTWEVDGSGDRAMLLAGPGLAVAAHADRVYVLGADAVRWGPWPEPGARMAVAGTLPAPGATDLVAWCDGQVMLSDDTGITRWDPATGQTNAFATDLPAIRSLALGPETTCASLYVLTDRALFRVTAEGRTVLLNGIESPRAVNRDREGHPWLVHGEPPVLSTLGDAGLKTMARHLGDPRDVQFGSGELFAPQNAYLADGEGTLDYARVIGR